jgi:voltage-gated potassium channel
MQRIKKRTYELIVEPPADDKIAQGVNNAILLLIAFNVVVFVLESVAPLRESYQGFFYYFEFVSVVIFSIEYLLRIWCCTHSENYREPIRGRLRMMGTPMALIDIIAILPFYLAALGFDLRFVRILRLVRLIRLFRSGRLAQAFSLLVVVVSDKKEELGISVLVLILVLTFSSSVMWYIECNEPGTQFTSVPATMWWGMMTITTIGYGDMYPMTAAGRVFGSFVGFLGICVFALPVGILGAGFADEIRSRREAQEKTPNTPSKNEGHLASGLESGHQCPHCGKEV